MLNWCDYGVDTDTLTDGLCRKIKISIWRPVIMKCTLIDRTETPQKRKIVISLATSDSGSAAIIAGSVVKIVVPRAIARMS